MTPKQRKLLIKNSKDHFAADMLLKGTYCKMNGPFRGCSIGCHVHQIHPDWSPEQIRYSDNHKIVSDFYGYPKWMARLQDTIFEGLPDDECNRWHVEFAEAIPSKPNWQRILHKVHIGILRISYRTAGKAKPVVQSVIDLHERALNGDTPSSDEWSAARFAARSAAYSAAESAARSAAESAMSAARSAAESAMSAAWSAAAWSAVIQEIRDVVLSALKDK